MGLDLENLFPEDLLDGVVFDGERGAYRCIFCSEAFEEGEVFPVDGRLFTAERAAREHLDRRHPDRLRALLEAGGKYVGLTEHQQELMSKLYRGMTDREIAGELGVSASTIRRQRFTFREKAKQAKLYLALYALACEGAGATGDRPVPVPATAAVADERFDLTEGERDKILQNAFESLSPLRLDHFPAKEKKKVAVLVRIAQEFQPGRRYTEPEVNVLLKAIFPDFATLRRTLIEYGFLERTPDCSAYWKR